MATETPVALTPLVPQRHGGALRRGNPGNKGGGRTSAAARLRCRTIFERNLKKVEGILDNPASTAKDICTAMDLVAKYGIGQAKAADVDDVKERLAKTLVILQEMLPREFAEAVLRRIETVWK